MRCRGTFLLLLMNKVQLAFFPLLLPTAMGRVVLDLCWEGNRLLREWWLVTYFCPGIRSLVKGRLSVPLWVQWTQPIWRKAIDGFLLTLQLIFVRRVPHAWQWLTWVIMHLICLIRMASLRNPSLSSCCWFRRSLNSLISWLLLIGLPPLMITPE